MLNHHTKDDPISSLISPVRDTEMKVTKEINNMIANHNLRYDCDERIPHLFIDLPNKSSDQNYIEDHQSSATNKLTGIFTP